MLCAMPKSIMLCQSKEEIRNGYITPVVLGIHIWAKWLRSPCCIGDPRSRDKIKYRYMAQMWAKWLHYPCGLGGPQNGEES